MVLRRLGLSLTREAVEFPPELRDPEKELFSNRADDGL